MINFQKTEFIKSASQPDDHLHDFNQVLFIGKSNVGKSSLINALTNKKNLAYVSKTPGQTKLINYYLVDNTFYLVDAPGFGYRRISAQKDDFDVLMDNYLKNNKDLKLIVYLIDSRRDLSQDELNVIEYIKSLSHEFLIIFTKADKLNQSEKSKIVKQITNLSLKNYLFSSINNEKYLNLIKEKIISYL